MSVLGSRARRRRGGSDKDAVQAGLELVKLEYISLRDETLKAMEAQQAILTWSLAAFGAVLAAGLLLVRSVGPFESHKPQDVMFLLIFGAGLPGFTFASCIAWFGELIRMERAGHYLRGLEIVIADMFKGAAVGSSFAHLAAPLRWETHIAFGRKKQIAVSKHQVGYVGHLAIYAGSMALALGICTVETWSFAFPSRASAIAVSAYAAAVFAFFVVVVLRLRNALVEAARTAADLDDVVPSHSRYPA